jgi:hypothetical protein
VVIQTKPATGNQWPVAKVLSKATAADLAKALKEIRGQ